MKKKRTPNRRVLKTFFQKADLKLKGLLLLEIYVMKKSHSWDLEITGEY